MNPLTSVSSHITSLLVFACFLLSLDQSFVSSAPALIHHLCLLPSWLLLLLLSLYTMETRNIGCSTVSTEKESLSDVFEAPYPSLCFCINSIVLTHHSSSPIRLVEPTSMHVRITIALIIINLTFRRRRHTEKKRKGPGSWR